MILYVTEMSLCVILHPLSHGAKRAVTVPGHMLCINSIRAKKIKCISVVSVSGCF